MGRRRRRCCLAQAMARRAARSCSKARRARCSTSTTARTRSSPRRTRRPAACARASASARRRSARVLGVAKAYTTRVGDGPLPTELSGAMGDRLREGGQEYGASTGRPRRCGWYDAVAVRYAARVNGLDALALTKLDVLDGLPHIEVCTAYRCGDRVLTEFPGDLRAAGRVRAGLRDAARVDDADARRPVVRRPAARGAALRRAARGSHGRAGRHHLDRLGARGHDLPGGLGGGQLVRRKQQRLVGSGRWTARTWPAAPCQPPTARFNFLRRSARSRGGRALRTRCRHARRLVRAPAPPAPTPRCRRPRSSSCRPGSSSACTVLLRLAAAAAPRAARHSSERSTTRPAGRPRASTDVFRSRNRSRAARAVVERLRSRAWTAGVGTAGAAGAARCAE